jgi:hypothetical protein
MLDIVVRWIYALVIIKYLHSIPTRDVMYPTPKPPSICRKEKEKNGIDAER